LIWKHPQPASNQANRHYHKKSGQYSSSSSLIKAYNAEFIFFYLINYYLRNKKATYHKKNIHTNKTARKNSDSCMK